MGSTYGIHIIVQSSHKGPEYLDSRIESFLRVYREILTKMEEETFRHYVQAVIENLTEKPKSLDNEASRHLEEIRAGTYLFGRKHLLAKILSDEKRVTLLRMVEFLDFYFLNSVTRKKFSSQFVGSGAVTVVAAVVDSDTAAAAAAVSSNTAATTSGNSDSTVGSTAVTATSGTTAEAEAESTSEVIHTITNHSLFKKSMPLLSVATCAL